MVAGWIGIIVGIAAVVFGIWSVASKSKTDSNNKNAWRVGGIVAIVVGIAMAAGLAFWMYGTEGGARAQKTFASDTGGGLTRTVKVYDMEGDLIETYEGKFDVEANADRILFDVPQPDGTYKRVQIWTKTGTVSIQEK